MSNLLYREDHTTDCWINLLRLPIITIVTSSLYNNILLCNTAWNKGSRIEKLAMCRYVIPMLRFRYFQVFLLPAVIALFFSRCFLFIYLSKKIKKVKIILTLRCTRGKEGWVCHLHRPLRFFWVFSQRPKHQHLMFSVPVSDLHPSSFICAHFESSSVMVSFYGYEI